MGSLSIIAKIVIFLIFFLWTKINNSDHMFRLLQNNKLKDIKVGEMINE